MMRKYRILMAVVLCLVVSAELRGEWADGPPKPVPYKAIPDPPDDAERHIVVKAADRGDVWLLTGRGRVALDRIFARVAPGYRI